MSHTYSSTQTNFFYEIYTIEHHIMAHISKFHVIRQNILVCGYCTSIYLCWKACTELILLYQVWPNHPHKIGYKSFLKIFNSFSCFSHRSSSLKQIGYCKWYPFSWMHWKVKENEKKNNHYVSTSSDNEVNRETNKESRKADEESELEVTFFS